VNLLDKGTPGQEAQEAGGFEKPSLPEAEAARLQRPLPRDVP
jgi:hypothetical protein